MRKNYKGDKSMQKLRKVHSEKNRIDCLNMSDIWDTLIRQTAHYTDRFASDLLYDYEDVVKFIKEYEHKTSKSFIFGLRRDGVDHDKWVFQAAKELNRYGKIYQLDITPDDEYYESYVKVELWEIDYTYNEKYDNAECTFAPNKEDEN